MRERVKFLIGVIAWLTLFAALPSQAQNDGVRLTMTFKNESLPNAFIKLEKSSSYKFLFTYNDVDKYVVNGTVKEAKFFDIVKFLLKDKPLTYSVNGKFVKIVKTNANTKKNDGKMKTYGGYVYDEKTGEPVIGAQVKLLNTPIVTVTGLDGSFNFEYLIPDNSSNKVQVSYIGMKTETVALAQSMKIFMKEDSKILDDVVVTGMFNRQKNTYTGAISHIDKEQLEMYRGTNLLQTLKNIDASINFPINNVAGSNPNVLPNLNIRGSSSLPMNVEEFNTNSEQLVNTPLIILDGFEISLTKLMDYNDEQIESINILKDASATAIYGSRGANGVIVVVTKKPKDGKLRVTAKAGVTIELPDLSSYDLLNASEKLELEKKVGLYTNAYYPSTQVRYDKIYNQRLKTVLDGTDIDWLSIPTRNGVGQNYNIQLDGGANEFRWGASLGYKDVEGAMKGSSRKTLNGDITLMYSIKNLLFRNYTSITQNNSKESKYGSFQDYVDQQPYNSPYDENGNLVKSFDDFTGEGEDVGNPLYDASLNTINKSEYFSFINNFSVEWIIAEGLRLRGKIGVQTTRGTSDYFLPSEHSTFNTAEYNSESGLLRKGSYTYGTNKDNLLTGNLTMSYTKVFNKKHQVYVGLDYSISEEKTQDYSFVAEGFTNEDLSSIINASQYAYNSAPTGTTNTIRLVGWTGNANYTYDNRYYVDLSYRIDGSSQFGSDKRFAPFWSAGLGWNVHNEKFMKDQKIFNNLRLKTSYGVTGSVDFTTESTNTTYKYLSGNRYLSWAAAQMMGLGNTSLTWQKTKEFNVGFEFGILNDLVRGEFNYYTKTTSNLLSSMDLPLSMGFDSYTANVGELKNNGIEASLNAYVIRNPKKRINLVIGGQIVYDKNKITKLSDAIVKQNEQYLAQNVDVSNLFYVGRPSNAIYAVRSLGIDPSTGNELFLDKNGNVTSTWNASDKVYLGSSQPLWRGNFHTMLMWGNFTANVSFAYHWGGKTYNSTLRDRVEVSKTTISEQNVDARVLSSRWMNPGDVTFFKNFSSLDTHATSRYVFDDRVLELQSVSLQYRWNTPWLQKATSLESAVFAISMSDLFYWSSVKYERGTDYPYARNLQATVTLTF